MAFLVLLGRQRHSVVLGDLGVADAFEHIGDGIIHNHDGTSFRSPRLPAGLADAGVWPL
jgi:hypothetical protein